MPVKKVSEKSVSINPSLQKLFLVAVALLTLLQTLMTIYFFTKAPGSASLSFWLYQGGTVLVPLFYFGLALWYVGAFGSLLNRIFKAAFVAGIGMLVLYSALQLVTMWPFVVSPDYTDESWLYYPYYLLGAVTAAYTFVLIKLKLHKGRK